MILEPEPSATTSTLDTTAEVTTTTTTTLTSKADRGQTVSEAVQEDNAEDPQVEPPEQKQSGGDSDSVAPLSAVTAVEPTAAEPTAAVVTTADGGSQAGLRTFAIQPTNIIGKSTFLCLIANLRTFYVRDIVEEHHFFCQFKQNKNSQETVGETYYYSFLCLDSFLTM